MGDSVAARLARAYELLALIERRRAEAGDECIGAAVERLILDRELRELEDLGRSDGMSRLCGAAHAIEHPKKPILR